MTVIINDTLGAYGGSHTLMVRMCEWLRANHIPVLMICDRTDNKEMMDRLATIKVKVVKVGGRRVPNIKRVISKLWDRELLVISFIWNYYFDVEIVKKRLNIEFDHILYCIVPDTFEKGAVFKSNLIRGLIIKAHARIFKRMNDNRSIIMMDEVCQERSEKYLKQPLDPPPQMIRLPIVFPKMDDYEEVIKRGYANNIILTASRADFPYKGYLLSLVDDFRRLKEKHPDLVLKMIAAGQDEDRLKERINALPEDVKKDVILIGWMPYDKLLNELENCKIFVGMSSVLIDAAKYYKVCVPSKGYTEDNLAASYFDEDPRYLYAPDDCATSAYPLIDRCFSWPYEEYRDKCIKNHDAAKELYEINNVMNQLILCRVKDKACVMTQYEIFRHEVNMVVNAVTHRDRNHFEFENISKSE